MSPAAMEDPLALKEKGNAAFKDGDMDLALSLYLQGLDISEKLEDKAILHKNCAAAYLKLSCHQEALEACTKSLELVPNDPKALFRRCQAYDALEQMENAYKDAREVHRLDPNNKAIQPYLTKLHKAFSEKMAVMSQTSSKVKNMFEIVFDPKQDQERREKGADNLVVLAKERAGAECLYKEGVVPNIARLMKVEKNPKLRLSIIRCIGELCKKSEEICKSVLNTCGIPFFLDILNSKEEETVNASSYVIQMMLDTLSHADVVKKIGEKRKNPRLMSSDDRKWCMEEEKKRMDLIANSKEINSIFKVILFNVSSRTLSGMARDALIELIMKNCKYTELNWAIDMLKTDGYERLMEVASEMTQYKHESSMEITDDTRSIVGICMSFCYDSMYDDKRRNALLEKVDGFIQDKLLDPSMESKVRCIVAITTMLQNATEIGQAQIAKEGILQIMLAMANSDEYLQQLVASEALIAAAQKKKDTSMLINQGIDVVKRLYNSKDDHIKVRALVAMCKLGASAGHDASLRPFADGSTTKLAEACRRFLISPGKDRDLRRWAAEGLSYLTLDAEVKEKLIDDESALKSLIELAREGKSDCQYPIVTLFVNLTNSYEKEEIMPEMLELAKFAKHHIPEEHELDDQDFVDKRVFTLAKLGITSALVALGKTESKNIRELISRVLNAVCKHNDLRGLVVQQGGTKLLTTLALDGTEKGMRQASQALARIGITQDPSIAFPGQRAIDVIRPICNLLNSEYGGLENFEALMALGNLASLDETTRKRMLKESDFVGMIETYMFEEHQLIRRAAVQCFTNLCASELQVKRCEGKNDKVKYCVLLCGDDEDIEVVRASSGALAMLTSQSEKVCKKVFESKQWSECILNLLANTELDIVLRGSVVVRNMIHAGHDIAERIIETQIMDCMQAHIFKAKLDEGSYKPDETLTKIRTIAEEALAKAHEYKLVKTKDEADKEPESDGE